MRKQAELDHLSRQPFACEADAQKALERFEKTLKYHLISDAAIVERPHYDHPGRPAQATPPTSLSYHIQATLRVDPDVDVRQRRRAGRFILATNVLASAKVPTDESSLHSSRLSTDELLTEYKAQQGVERGFRFLKDPLFFTPSVFLKSPERIMAMAMIMGLSLMVHNLGQRTLRNALKSARETIPNQLGKLTQTPTLR